MSSKKELDRQMRQVMAVIRKHRRFTVSSHINPEGDALGSAIALASLLRRLGKEAKVANDGGVPEAFDFFPQLAPVISKPARNGSAEVAMTVDVPLLSRTGSMEPMIYNTPVRVNIDHHISNQRFGDVNWVDPKAAAAGEMIYRLYRAFKLRPTRPEAVCLYVSLVTDTGSFRYMSTTPEVHQIASDLIAIGVSPLKVAQDLYECHTAKDMKFLGAVLGAIQTDSGSKIAWLEVPNKLLQTGKPGSEIIAELVNFPRAVKTAEIAFVLREDKKNQKIRISFRSKGKVDVNRLARLFGGGGHVAASGCTIEGTLVSARRRILREARKALKGLSKKK